MRLSWILLLALEDAIETSLPAFAEIDRHTAVKLQRVQSAFRDEGIGPHHFAGSTGYGHGDLGRAMLDAVLARVLGTEACFARASLGGAEHALACALFACLRPGDTLQIATGAARGGARAVIYDGPGSLRSWGVHTREIPLRQGCGEIDRDALEAALSDGPPAAVLIQRAPDAFELAAGARSSFVSGAVCREVVDAVRSACPGAAVIVDNAGAELLERDEVGTAAAADLATGSLGGVLGGSVAPGGGYVAGRADLVERACAHMSAPGLSLDAGSISGDALRLMFQGVFMAPGLAGELRKGAAFMQHALPSSWLEPDGHTGPCGAFPLTRLVLPTEAAATALLDAVSTFAPPTQPDGCSPRQVGLPGGAHGALAGCTAGRTSAIGATAQIQALASLTPPHRVALYGGTHWTQWLNVLTSAWPHLSAN